MNLVNSQRSGVTANMTMGEYAATKNIDPGHVQITTHDHKTFRYYGPARITLAIEEFDMLKIFVERAREKLLLRSSVGVQWLRGISAAG